jgi:hypothetical protein
MRQLNPSSANWDKRYDWKYWNNWTPNRSKEEEKEKANPLVCVASLRYFCSFLWPALLTEYLQWDDQKVPAGVLKDWERQNETEADWRSRRSEVKEWL